MSDLNFSKIVTAVLSKQMKEQKIAKYKTFYKNYLSGVKNRQEILRLLYPMCIWFQNYEFFNAFSFAKEKNIYESKVIELLKKYFKPQILEIYQKLVPNEVKKINPDDNLPVWLQFVIGILSIPHEIDERYRKEWEYKTRFLNFLHDCLYYCGLPPEAHQRESGLYKRYNFLLEHDFKSKIKLTEYKTLMNLDKLKSEIILPYEKRKPILIGGKLIPQKNICKIKITSTLLFNDELELFAIQKGYLWTEKIKDVQDFLNSCVDETEELLRNPYILMDNPSFRNSNIYFVDPGRISELQKIRNTKFDLSKLLQMCKELNDVSINGNHYSISSLVRSIIDHIPPVFGHKSFSEVANNYKQGTRSFKKGMLHLENSLRNIADNNLHSQIRNKESVSNKTQTDFSPELDLLLSEIVRILK